MKQLLALFCAVVLLPTLNSYAWIGGPFSNNQFFSEGGDDGVYEAVGTIPNGVGMYRWAVTNSATSLPDTGALTTFTSTFTEIIGFFADGTPITQSFTTTGVSIISSNTTFGGLEDISHRWFIEGVSYTGTCSGTANSGIGVVTAVGTAESEDDVAIGSSFFAEFDHGEGIPVSRFSGTGEVTDVANVDNDPETDIIEFPVFGSKVSSEVVYR